eukprot:TRINITY_DN1833_c0_g1_i1.p1 TRINITY_DN1833_c0_g1~~TRINITY_DN1833_c0_g1_i1.p1  ORF type:complete len:243 (+),score=28.91 TRINITY_DN1833_c0_g1_i1:338-1066(+)
MKLIFLVFSTFGAANLVPLLYNTLTTKGWQYSICEPSTNWYLEPPYGFWVALFIYSKFPELVDTVFLVLRKKPVIFLHWFHHVTVLLYCWHAYHHQVAAGLWFATMNYSVHSIMYLYYFLMNAGFYKLMRPIAPFITAIQLLQMIGGVVVLSAVALTLHRGEACAMDRANYKLGLIMYLSYFVLFAVLFWDKYIAVPQCSAKPNERLLETTGCVANESELDAGGLFRPDEREPGKSKKEKKL